jgi:hypothetical protein
VKRRYSIEFVIGIAPQLMHIEHKDRDISVLDQGRVFVTILAQYWYRIVLSLQTFV